VRASLILKVSEFIDFNSTASVYNLEKKMMLFCKHFKHILLYSVDPADSNFMPLS
jgi:hypothetical protein